MCYEPMLQHDCARKEWRFYFDMAKHDCVGTMACTGGANNFKTWQECHDACVKFMPPKVVTSTETNVPYIPNHLD